MSPELYLAHGVILDLDALGVGLGVEDGFDVQAGAGLGGPYQVDDGFVVHQRLATPVDADEREEAVLDLVPLTRPGWIVANRDRHSDLVGKTLQSELPCSKLGAVAATAVLRLRRIKIRSRRRSPGSGRCRLVAYFPRLLITNRDLLTMFNKSRGSLAFHFFFYISIS